MHRKRPILIALAFFVLAGTLLAYPWVSSLLSEKHHSDVETAYCTAMDSTSKQDLELKRQQAVAYNQMLRLAMYWAVLCRSVVKTPIPFCQPTAA